MRISVAGALLAGSVWLLAAVLAWPTRHPTAAVVVVLVVQAGFYAVIAVIAVREAAAGHPTIRVQIRRRDHR